MDIGTISLVLLIGIFVLLAIGMPLGFASGFLAVAVLVMKFGPEALFKTFGTGILNILAQRMYGLLTDYVLISVPLFIFMACLLERSNIAKAMFDSLNIWLSRTRGGLAVVTAIMAIIMAAMSGIIGGEVVLLGLIALPNMLRLGYNQNLAIGTICASGSLGTMIPPSIVLIIYGLVTETSIHALFKAAFVPGLILGGCYILYIIVRTRLNPELAPLPEGGESVTMAEKLRALPGLLAPLTVVFVVLGSIYGGITGITEAAGMGVVAVLVLILIRGEMSWTLVKEALMRTYKSTGTILWITFGATALAGAYSLAGGPTYVANLIVGSDLPTFGILLVMMVIFLILGAIMDWVGIVLLVMPVFLPIVLKLPIDEIGLTGALVAAPTFLSVWFGILFCVNMQVSFLSPPFGPAAFYLKSVAPPHISLVDIFRSFLPFICLQLFVLALIFLFPELTMFFR
ncbi:TRAP transporter large permease [Denitrobaculum tricleocarpae]|uniref:TRAP transporter large permease subunit n=1 Tax=Denitrobaculum tricleocarpae TaxID=2591009 RepID=A0A545T5N4_9PROT|nr:TRAP transporter large permease subunit [Denitrobaculum tricleocarpae]TQV72529.1 TRAP transporter large permease subunit [Denitrobaculum tricleocarpae]